MFVDKTIQRERSRTLDNHHQGQCDCQQMVLNPVSFLGSEPVQEQAESEMNSCDSAYHRERDDECGNSAEQPDDESNSTEKFPGDHKKGQSRRNAMFAPFTSSN